MKTRFILFTVFVLAIFWLNAALDMRDRRSGAIREAERETSTLALTLEEQALNSISAADLTLRLIVRMAEENDWATANNATGVAAIEAALKKMANDVPQVNNLAVVDREGAFRAQSIGYVKGMTAVDREYYLVHRRAPDIGLHISPAVRGRMSGRNVITVSRTIFDKDGAFAGTAVAAMNPDYFHTTYTALDLGQNGAIALFDINGAVINRKPNPGNVIGESVARYPLFREYLPRSSNGSFTATSPLDNHVRIVSYRRVATTPFVVVVGKSLSETLEPWRREVWQTALTLGVITLLMIGGCAIILRETARRQQSQKSLEDSERRFRSTFDRAPVGIGHLDLQGHWLLTNPALRDILGYAEEELSALDMLTLTHPDDRANSRVAFTAMLAGKRDVQFTEKRYVRKDGKTVWVNLTASPQKDDKGKPRYILSIVSDITSRKATEADLIGKSEQLRQSEEVSRQQALILESIIASMADGVMVAGENKHFLLFNPAAHKLFGAPPEKAFAPEDCIRLFGLYRLDMKTPLSVDEVPLARALRGEHVDSAEIYVRNAATPDGAFVSISACPMTDDTGVIRGAVVVCRDITEARLTEDALRQAQKMEAVGQLTGGIAHDFNNLLQVILGNSEILAEVLDNARHQRLAQMSLMAAQRGAELTSQLLSFSRRQSLQPQPIDVRKLVTGTEGLLSGAIGATIALKQEFPADLWRAVVDPGMLQNAMVNLVLNARDAMPDGGRITIQATNFICDQAYASRHKEVPLGEYVRISITDTGLGISEANLEKVFEPFFTTKDVGKGSGLGLSMVYGFIQQSGGAIRISSTEGRGTVVRLYLPRATAAPVQECPITAESAPEGSETILVAEDDPLVRDFVVAALSSLGYTVVQTTDGETALQCLKSYESPVHLLFTDIVMPGGLNGWELARRAVALRPSLRVLFTSGYTDTAGLALSKSDLGPLLNKPYGKAELATAVRRALATDKELVHN